MGEGSAGGDEACGTGAGGCGPWGGFKWRIYDAHIADVARTAGATVIVTDNRRHFLTALRHGIRVETPAEFAAALKTKRGR